MKITDGQLIMYVLFLVFIELVIQVAWLAADPQEVKEIEEDIVGGATIIRYECGSDEGTFPMLASVYRLALILGGCYLSWVTRNVNPKFSESKQIMLGIYLIAILGGLTFILVVGFGLDPDAAQLLQALGVFLSVVSAVMAIFVPKMLGLNKTQQDLMSTQTSVKTGGAKTSASSGADEEVEELK